jgi:hypothetical protein
MTKKSEEKLWDKRGRFILSAVLVLALVVALAACGGSDDIDEVKAQPYSVDFTGVRPSDSGATYGEFVESYCPGGKWEQFSSGGDSFVNYIGGDSPEGGVDIQWLKNSSGWAVYAVEINGEGVSLAHINTFFSSASSASAAVEQPADPSQVKLFIS